MQLAPMPESCDVDRGLLLSVQAIQVIFLIKYCFRHLCFHCDTLTMLVTVLATVQALLENKGAPVIVGIGNTIPNECLVGFLLFDEIQE